MEIKKLSIVGAGQIGPDIILHFAKVFAGKNVRLVLVNISEEQLKNAQKKIKKKIAKGVEAGAFKTEQADEMQKNILYTLNYSEVSGSDMVIEAATEDENIKDKIFSQLETLCDEQTIFLSNSSHMQPEVIFRNIKNKSHCLVAHYFFPADRNPVVEIVPSSQTDKILVEQLLKFYESIGKVPIEVKSSYGYAIDPIFEGLCQSAIMCLEKNWGNEMQIDKVASEVLGLGVGPFTALNLTGGNPITNHGLDMMHNLVHPWFKTPIALSDAAKNKSLWNSVARDEKVEVPEELYSKIKDEFLGSYFFLSSLIIDLGITNVKDLDMACELALVIKPPFTFMNSLGIRNVYESVKQFCVSNSIAIPKSLSEAIEKGGWKTGHVTKKIVDHVAVLTIRKPKSLNALNTPLLDELRNLFSEIEEDKNIIGSVLTGFGNKSFVSGADIKELAACKNPEEGISHSQHFQSILSFIESMSKPLVCAYNGFAFGGGNELGMACSLRICKKDLPVAFCQPEVNLGFIPGAGGTQRLPRIIGIEKAAEILRTGKPVSSKEAAEMKFIYKEVKGDLVFEGVSIVKDIVAGKIQPKKISRDPIISNGQSLVRIEIGHHSKKIDGILCRAIYEGARMKLEDGLKLESKLFGECILTRDMKIGVDTFMSKGAKSKAEFVNA